VGKTERPHDADRHLSGWAAGNHAVLDGRRATLRNGGRLQRGQAGSRLLEAELVRRRAVEARRERPGAGLRRRPGDR
jgi:hypothetical protein